MTENIGKTDRIVRVVVGLLLVAFAMPLGFPETGWNWLGWIGLIPLMTAFFGICPAYTALGISTADGAEGLMH